MRFFIRLLLTMIIAAAVAQPATAQEGWIRWVDPAERAFSLDAPAGWRVKGGLRRHAAVDVRPEVTMTSPDGLIFIRIGDAANPTMVQPNQQMAAMGFVEGRWYSPGYGVNMLVMRYLPGARFALDYYLPKSLGPISQVIVRELNQPSNQAMSIMASAGIQGRVDTADLTFQTTEAQGPRQGYLLIQTRLIIAPGAPDMGNWEVTKLSGYLAAPQALPQAWRIYTRALGSFQWDPYWWEGQMRQVGATSYVVSRTENEMARIIQEMTYHRQQVADEAHQKWTEYIRGTRTFTGPDGNPREIDANADQYVMAPDGRIFGRDQNLGNEGFYVGQDGAYYTKE